MKTITCLVTLVLYSTSLAEDAPDYTREVAPILRKYCAGCHNEAEANGELRLDSYNELLKGGEHGPALIAGDAKISRMIRMMTGQTDTKMPPEDEKQPSEDDVAVLVAWINAGAKGPEGSEPIMVLQTPTIPPAEGDKPITALAYSSDLPYLAVARYRQVDICLGNKKVLRVLGEHAGKVNDVAFTADGSLLYAASGVTGLSGEVRIWNPYKGQLVGKFDCHSDAVQTLAISPDGKRLATGSYDRKVIIWDALAKKPIHTLGQHNGAIYDLAFSPDGKLLASASADETVKIWNVATGERLDTLGQPEGEQYAVLFSPDGKFVVAGGADNRIRVWEVLSRETPRINPLKFARFAHEGAIVALLWREAEGTDMLVSAADDRTLKLWSTRRFTEIKAYPEQPGIPSSLTGTLLADESYDGGFYVGRLDGSPQYYRYPYIRPSRGIGTAQPAFQPEPIDPATPLTDVAETEPNNDPAHATQVTAPANITGTIDSQIAKEQDIDLFRFTSQAGQQWILETKAARMKSPLDTKIEVLDAEGNRIPRVLLQAVRDSYFTFRGKDSKQTGDFRIHNWQEMQLNQLLYAQGEVVKLFHWPRGPDSGFDVYPKFGNRHNFFDTTAVSHALGEPCYIVEPHPPTAQLIPNGLPVFPIYFENDDDAQRELGTDSRLTFTAPKEGEYLVRVSDTRNFQGEDYKYELTIRAPQPDFNIRIEGAGATVNRGSGKMFTLKADRIDGYNGKIEFEITGVPDGFYVTSPLTIEAGQFTAQGAVYAFPDATEAAAEGWNVLQIVAKAVIDGKKVSKQVGNLGHVKLAAVPKILLTLSPKNAAPSPPGEIPEVTIAPGETIETTLRITRSGNNGVLGFGKEDAGRNLPHGTYVDNIGLNGVLLLAGQNQRGVFITADSWVPSTSRLFFLRSDQEGGQCSWPVRLIIRDD